MKLKLDSIYPCSQKIVELCNYADKRRWEAVHFHEIFTERKKNLVHTFSISNVYQPRLLLVPVCKSVESEGACTVLDCTEKGRCCTCMCVCVHLYACDVSFLRKVGMAFGN